MFSFLIKKVAELLSFIKSFFTSEDSYLQCSHCRVIRVDKTIGGLLIVPFLPRRTPVSIDAGAVCQNCGRGIIFKIKRM